VLVVLVVRRRAISRHQWCRDNQYSYSMCVTTQHNEAINLQPVENDGMLKTRYEADDELR